MLSAAQFRRPVALLLAVFTTAVLFAALATGQNQATAATVGAKAVVKADIDAVVKIKTGLLGSRVTVLGDLNVPVDANVNLTGQKVALRVNGGNVLCVATATSTGLLKCDAVVNAVVRSTLKRVGAVVSFAGGTVKAVVDGVKVDAKVDATAVVKALVEV